MSHFDYFASDRLDVTRNDRARGVLETARWCWPKEAERLDRAKRIAPSGPPSSRPGEALLVTGAPHQSTLWAFTPVVGRSGSVESANFTEHARNVWLHALDVLPRVAPLVWKPVDVQRAASLRARRLFCRVLQGQERGESVELGIEGESFGLSFLLAAFSWLIDRPIPTRFAASVALDGSYPTCVGLIPQKIAVIAAYAPSVTRLLVARAQASEARSAAKGTTLRIKPVDSLEQAVQLVFGTQAVDRAFARAGRTNKGREALVGDFVSMTRSSMRPGAREPWAAVHRAAARATETWAARLTPGQLVRLRFCAGVAARHADNRGSLPALDELGFADLDDATRLSFLAHMLQGSADWGSPAPSEIEGFARKYADLRPSALSDHLGVAGALGRLLAVTGRLEDALTLQECAVEGLERTSPASCGRPLSECFRVAGVLGRVDAFERAQRRLESLDSKGALGRLDTAYVRLSRAKANIQMKHAYAQGAQEMAVLYKDDGLPVHVKWSAARWLVRTLAESGRGQEADAVFTVLIDAAAAGDDDARIAQRYCAFISLDRALAEGERDAADRALLQLTRLEAGVIANLSAAAASAAVDAAEYVAKTFPY